MAKSKQSWNLRDPETRAAFAKAVTKLFRGKQPLKARAIASELGADMPQVRKTLNDLIEEGVLTYSGNTRATEYARA